VKFVPHSLMDEQQEKRVKLVKFVAHSFTDEHRRQESQLVKTSSRPVKPTQCIVTEDTLGVSV
jgi:hypothetical protein